MGLYMKQIGLFFSAVVALRLCVLVALEKSPESYESVVLTLPNDGTGQQAITWRMPINFTQTEVSVSMEVIQAQRKQLMERVCPYSNEDDVKSMFSDREMLDHLIVDDKNRLIYCYVPKVACTNWKRLLMVLSGKANTTDPSEVDRTEAHQFKVFRRLSSYARKEAQYRLDNYLKFTFVRHPFERLLSAYRSKFDNINNSTFFKRTFGTKIVKRYRGSKVSQKSLTSGDDVTFEEFVRYVINPLTPRPFNEHWRPASELCRPCQIRYDVIGHYETLNEDTQFVLQRLKLDRPLSFPTQLSLNSSALLEEFYSRLSREDLMHLYHVYQMDFRLNGYQFDHLY